MNGFIHFPAYSRFLSYLSAQESPEGLTFSLEQSVIDKPSLLLLTYDLKNRFENLSSRNIAAFNLPHLSKYGIGNKIIFPGAVNSKDVRSFKIKQRTSKERYLENVLKLKQHIQRGDIYEINYCIEFYTEDAVVDPVAIFKKLSSISEAPFSFLAKIDSFYVLCASPERFIRKEGRRLISQPIKGTRKRSSDLLEDKRLADELQTDLKERTENVMIVDLVRNDLSRIADRGTVKVEELCKIYSFKQVHQMISTVVCETSVNNPEEIFKATFPMGSMTGAPKIRAMQLADAVEDFNRELYSGSVGIVKPDGDFDLNVMIRSIFYDEKKRYLSFSVGSAITARADAAKEYEECLLKARAMFNALGCEDQWKQLSDE